MIPSNHALFFDLEGPLSPQDNAQELFKQTVKHGKELFKLISRYDDLLVLEGRPDYEPGDTLALILPFLADVGVTVDDVLRVSQETTTLVPGAIELFDELSGSPGVDLSILSSSYTPHAENAAFLAGFPREKVVATPISDEHIASFATTEVRHSLAAVERALLGSINSDLNTGSADRALRQILDPFYWTSLPQIMGRAPNAVVVPHGGRKKVRSLERRTHSLGLSTDRACFVGDSITDVAALQYVNAGGGLAVAFNANEYALPHATVAVASTVVTDVLPVVRAWLQDGRSGAYGVATAASDPTTVWVSGLSTAHLNEVLLTHEKYRGGVRGDAGELG